MSGNIILGILIIASLAVVMLFIPHLVFGLNFKDGSKSLFDGKYLLFLFAHRRYCRVKSGKQTYERYCNDIRSIFNERGFNRSKSAVENNKKIHDRAILSEMLSDLHHDTAKLLLFASHHNTIAIVNSAYTIANL